MRFNGIDTVILQMLVYVCAIVHNFVWTVFFKGRFRDHSRDNALNFHKIRDFCILVMVLDV